MTGASGFIGRALYTMMRQRGLPVRCALRRPDPTCDESVVVGDVGPQTDWAAALHGVKTVVHLAALVHNLGTLSADEAAAYHEVNAVGTLRLVQQAIAAGVQRFVFVSSAVVHGERTNGHPFDHASPPDPQTAYAQSKWDGERMIADLPGIEIVIVRPPLVYGERVRANFLRLIRLVDSGLPLPFAGIRNRRSLIGLTNLCDFFNRLRAGFGGGGRDVRDQRSACDVHARTRRQDRSGARSPAHPRAGSRAAGARRGAIPPP